MCEVHTGKSKRETAQKSLVRCSDKEESLLAFLHFCFAQRYVGEQTGSIICDHDNENTENTTPKRFYPLYTQTRVVWQRERKTWEIFERICSSISLSRQNFGPAPLHMFSVVVQSEFLFMKEYQKIVGQWRHHDRDCSNVFQNKQSHDFSLIDSFFLLIISNPALRLNISSWES